MRGAADIREMQQVLEPCAELEAWNARLLAEIDAYRELPAFRSQGRPSEAPASTHQH
ncbi:MAG: hypothetical protein WCL53_05090 [Chloroflexota bacterium]